MKIVFELNSTLPEKEAKQFLIDAMQKLAFVMAENLAKGRHDWVWEGGGGNFADGSSFAITKVSA